MHSNPMNQRLLTALTLLLLCTTNCEAAMEKPSAKTDYLDSIRDKILPWEEMPDHPEYTHRRHPTVTLKIADDGSLADIAVVQSSGDKAYDESIVALIKSRAPFGPPPEKGMTFTWDLLYGAEPSETLKYRSGLQARIRKNFYFPLKHYAGNALVSFRINRDGTFEKVRLSSSSGNTLLDAAALDAVKRTAEFKHLPVGSPRYMDTEFTFAPYGDSKNKSTAIAERQLSTAEKPSNYSAILNNRGVELLMHRKFDAAIGTFIEALKCDPTYVYAKTNLGIAYNNLALKYPPEGAVEQFRRALLVDPDNATTLANFKEALTSFKKDANSADDHIKLAKDCEARDDKIGACVHYRLANTLKPDPQIAQTAEGLQAAAMAQLLGQ